MAKITVWRAAAVVAVVVCGFVGFGILMNQHQEARDSQIQHSRSILYEVGSALREHFVSVGNYPDENEWTGAVLARLPLVLRDQRVAPQGGGIVDSFGEPLVYVRSTSSCAFVSSPNSRSSQIGAKKTTLTVLKLDKTDVQRIYVDVRGSRLEEVLRSLSCTDARQ